MPNFSASAPLSLTSLALNMLVGLILSLTVAWYYEHFGQSLSNRSKLAQLIPVLTLTTALIISIVKSSLALTLGLVGALSIVRFRTAVKEPEELMFLFFSIAIGLGAGADQRWLTVVGTIIILGYMAVRLLLSRKSQSSNLYLNLTLNNENQQALFDRVNTRLLEHVEMLDFRRLDAHDGALQLTYFIRCSDPRKLNNLIDDLKSQFPVIELSFIQQDQILGS